jgi:hypothetical protein
MLGLALPALLPPKSTCPQNWPLGVWDGDGFRGKEWQGYHNRPVPIGLVNRTTPLWPTRSAGPSETRGLRRRCKRRAKSVCGGATVQHPPRHPLRPRDGWGQRLCPRIKDAFTGPGPAHPLSLAGEDLQSIFARSRVHRFKKYAGQRPQPPARPWPGALARLHPAAQHYAFLASGRIFSTFAIRASFWKGFAM